MMLTLSMKIIATINQESESSKNKMKAACKASAIIRRINGDANQAMDLKEHDFLLKIFSTNET